MKHLDAVAGLSDTQQALLFRAFLHQLAIEAVVLQGTKFSNDPKVLVEQLQLKAYESLGRRGLEQLVVFAPGAHTETPQPPNLASLVHLMPEVKLPPLKSLLKASVTMKLPAECSGWAARMAKLGYKVSSRDEKFGRQAHVIKRDKVHLNLLQGGSAVVQNKLTELNLAQLEIIEDLRSVGALMD